MFLRVRDIREMFKSKYLLNQTNKRGMLEIIGASFIADGDFIFGTPDRTYIDREISWYMSQSLNVYDMVNPPKVWMDVASSYGTINSNYGYLIFSKENGEQFKNVIRTLRRRPDSKQASMIYTRPSMHSDSYVDGMKDFICTNAVSYNMNQEDESKIDCVVQMRSNDAIYGYKNDYAWQKFILDKVCSELGKIPGTIYWQVANLHIYPRHFHLIDS